MVPDNFEIIDWYQTSCWRKQQFGHLA